MAVFINRMNVPVLTFVGSDDVRVGETIARALFQGLGGTGKVVALDGTPEGAKHAVDALTIGLSATH